MKENDGTGKPDTTRRDFIKGVGHLFWSYP